MQRGLYVAASGMLAELARQSTLANDLANSTTPGYKADRVSQESFGRMLLANTKTGQAVGELGLGAQVTDQQVDLRPQALKQTDEPLDLAVEGEGWFGVRTPQGIRYTRNGAFQAGAGGMLVDQMGNPVLGRDRQPVRLQPGGTVDGRDVGVFSVPAARRAGDSYFTGQARGDGEGRVRTGALESSGVDSARTMVSMIASLRAFESAQRAITTIDDTLKQSAQQVGSLR